MVVAGSHRPVLRDSHWKVDVGASWLELEYVTSEWRGVERVARGRERMAGELEGSKRDGGRERKRGGE